MHMMARSNAAIAAVPSRSSRSTSADPTAAALLHAAMTLAVQLGRGEVIDSAVLRTAM